jgi:hypothetical protein
MAETPLPALFGTPAAAATTTKAMSMNSWIVTGLVALIAAGLSSWGTYAYINKNDATASDMKLYGLTGLVGVLIFLIVFALGYYVATRWL